MAVEEAAWEDLEDWRLETIARLRRRVVSEFQEGRYHREFEAKMQDRHIIPAMVIETLRSARTYIVSYREARDRTRRIGFWHPRIKLFVAWKPGRESRITTCFRKENGLYYIESKLEDARPVFRP